MKLEKVSKEFAGDLISLVNSLKDIPLNGSSQYQNRCFKYVTLDSILKTIKANNNFALLMPMGTNEHGESALQVILVHKSGETLTSDYYRLRVRENGSKQDEGSSIMYTKRYALGSFLGLCTDEDNDANPDGNGMPLGQPKQQPRQSPRQSSQQRGGQHQTPGARGNNARQQAPQRTPGGLTKAQLDRMSRKAKAAGVTPDQVTEFVVKRYKKHCVQELNATEYGDLCTHLDNHAAQAQEEEEK